MTERDRTWSSTAYRVLGPWRPGRLLPAPAARLARRLVVDMPAEEVLEVADAMRSARVRAALAGGWGVDALLTRQTRRHSDLDLVVQRRPEGPPHAAERVLEELGYEVVDRLVGGRWMPEVVVCRNQAGRTVELQPLAGFPRITTGTVRGRTVPCLTLATQVRYHRGYRKRLDDRLDLARLERAKNGKDPQGRLRTAARSSAEQALRRAARAVRRVVARVRGSRRTSALVVLVPPAEPLLARWSPDADVPAHVTVLYPFLRPGRLDRATREALTRAAAQVPAFEVVLDEVGRFPDATYLAPRSPEPFAALLASVQAEWPSLEPYGGEFAELVPHLTILEGVEPPDLEPTLRESLPVAMRARELTLLVQERGGGWSVAGRFPLLRTKPS